MKTITLSSALTALLLTGCIGASKHGVQLQPGHVMPSAPALRVGEVTNVTGRTYDFDVTGELLKKLSAALATARLDQGTENLELNLQITDYEKGNAFGRWLMPGVGSTRLTVTGVMSKADSREVVAKIDAHRTVEMGGLYSVGQWKIIFESVADDIVKDLKKHLGQK